eukprot:193215-Lingulodinium_polyedra.AAC.1
MPAGEDIPAYVASRKALLADDPRTIGVLVSENRSFIDAVRDMTTDQNIVLGITGPRTASPYLDRV